MKRAKELFELYNSFKVQSITTRRFNQSQMLHWMQPFLDKSLISPETLGTSGDGRTISLYSYGTGATGVLLWSQMHGDEPTATMALLDMLGFFALYPDHEVSTLIRERSNLRMIPMLNPDGAERFTRRNGLLIDINRDAMALQTPEARILKETRDRLAPQFGFNLHDQDPRYTVGTTRQITAIALLAPAFDEQRSDNAVRTRAKKIAALLAESLQPFIPRNLAKWDDAYEPRAFGDGVQRWGTSTVLIESGGWRGDRDKMFLRKLNCVGLLAALAAIADGSYERADAGLYERIPFNTKLGYDLIIRNAQFTLHEYAKAVRIDVGINYEEVVDTQGTVSLMGKIVDVGDLSTFTSFEEVDAAGRSLDQKRIGIDMPISVAEIRTLLR